MIEAAIEALGALLEFHRLAFLFGGVLVGLLVGMVPGVSGVAGLAMLLPFTMDMDAFSAFAFLLGLGSVTATSDTIPAVLYGVPGTAAAQATVLDGHAMAKRGEAGRALSAAYVSSLIGGLFGALALGLALPILRPVILFVGTPELLALSVLGISTVSVLAGNTPLRGLAVAGFAIMVSMIGGDPQTDTPRWTFGSLYLSDGLPLLPVAIGIFALPELCDLAISRSRISRVAAQGVRSGMLRGTRDALANWWLILRCSVIGTAVGALPGLGGSVIDWFAYGHARRSVRGADETFGTGDVRGVIAPESANNAKEGGALVPTVAFGVPGSASMAILLGAFLVHGLVPGPAMLSENLALTYSMVWSVALANILGAGVCFLLSGPFSRIASLRFTLVVPAMFCVLVIGAFQSSRDWGDLYALLAFGVLGWAMKRLGWPRPPFILGFVLGPLIERHASIAWSRYGLEWFLRPLVLVILIASAIILMRPLLRELGRTWANRQTVRLAGPSFEPSGLLHLLILATVGAMMIPTGGWAPEARFAPILVGTLTLACTGAALLYQTFVKRRPGAAASAGKSPALTMDLGAEPTEEVGLVLRRAGHFLLWLLFYLVAMRTVGAIPAAVLLVAGYQRLEGRESWLLVTIYALAVGLFLTVFFDRLLAIPWPTTLIGDLWPALAFLPSV